MSEKRGHSKSFRSQKSSRTREILQNASTALEVASNLAPLIPVPALSSVFTAAKCIIDASIKQRQDKQAAAELAEYAASLTCHVHKTLRGKENMINKDLSLSLNQLSSVLEEVKVYMEYQAALRLWQRLCFRSDISNKLAEYRIRMAYTMQTFATTSNLRLELGLGYLKNGMDELRAATQNSQAYDGQYRIYHWGEIEIIRSQEQSIELLRSSDIEIYEAKVESGVKIVKVYRNREAYEHSIRVLKLVRNHPRIPFAQLEGYANDPSSLFIVLKGGLSSMFEYLVDLGTIDYFLERLRFMIEMKRAMLFLASHNLRWEARVECLMISASGRLAIGCGDDIVHRMDTDDAAMRVLISWPKPGVAEGLHILVDREDVTLSSLYAALQNIENRLSLNAMSGLWGQYIDELSCGITSFVSVTNLQPPAIGSVGHFKLEEGGLRFAVLENPFEGVVNVRTTNQLKTRADNEESNGTLRFCEESDWRDIVDENISMPLCLSKDKGSLHTSRTSYIHLSCHGWAAKQLVESGFRTSHVDLESLVVVTGVIERATAIFSNEYSESSLLAQVQPQQTYYHARPPDKSGFLQKPWGYLSRTHTTLGSTNTTLETNLAVSNFPEPVPDTFDLTLAGVVAHLEQSFKLSCFQFSTAEASAIREMYSMVSAT